MILHKYILLFLPTIYIGSFTISTERDGKTNNMYSYCIDTAYTY